MTSHDEVEHIRKCINLYQSHEWVEASCKKLIAAYDRMVDQRNMWKDRVDELTELSNSMRARIAELDAECEAWRDCVQIDAMMEGPRFKGVDRSAAKRAFEQYWRRAP